MSRLKVRQCLGNKSSDGEAALLLELQVTVLSCVCFCLRAPGTEHKNHSVSCTQRGNESVGRWSISLSDEDRVSKLDYWQTRKGPRFKAHSRLQRRQPEDAAF